MFSMDKATGKFGSNLKKWKTIVSSRLKNFHNCTLSDNSSYESTLTSCQRLRVASGSSRIARRLFPSRAALSREQQRHIDQYPCMIHPLSTVNWWWQIFLTIFFLMFSLYIPIEIVYNSTCSNIHRSIMFTINVILFISVIMNFFTGYVTQDNMICLNPKLVFSRYMKTFFFVDFPFGFFIRCGNSGDSFGWKLTGDIFRMTKLVRFVTYLRNLDNIALELELPMNKYRLGRSLNIGFMIIHWLTCFQFLCAFLHMGYYQIGTNNLDESVWMHKYPRATTAFEWYIHSMFRTVSLLRLAGLSCKSPNTRWEIFFMLLTFVVAIIFRISFLSTLRSLSKGKKSAKVKYYMMVKQTQAYMHHKEIPKYLIEKVQTYYEVRYKYSYYNETDILNCVSDQLRRDITMHSCHHLVINMPFFNKMPEDLLSQIVTSLKSEVYLTNDVIIKQGTYGDCMYFISKGSVAVYSPSGKEICHLEDGTHFGEVCLVVVDHLRTTSVIAIESCEVFRLDRKDFERILSPYPQIYDKIVVLAMDRLEKMRLINDQHVISLAERKSVLVGK